ncbi:hypothetical protein TNCV_3310931 [Trichonephila clavipes]|nr:hypothetical protein TNCV_3310931 [Trichonephila clavipes]
MSQRKAAIATACLRLEIRYSKIVTMASFARKTAMMKYWETKGRTKNFSQRRPLATSNADERYLSLCERRNGTVVHAKRRSSLAASSRRFISRSTVCLYSRRPAICVPLT